MDATRIEHLLRLLGEELRKENLTGEIVLVGEAVMLLVVGNRDATKHVDAYFLTEPAKIREAARRVADAEGISEDWIDDAVKGFFYSRPDTELWREYPGIRVYAASLEYVMALKSLAARPQDAPDILALAGRLGLREPEDILGIVERFVPERLLTAKTRLLIENLFEEAGDE